MGFDHAAFVDRYGFDVQEFVNRSAVAMALAVKLPAEKADLATAEKALAALGDQDAINGGQDTRKIQDLADAVNLVAAKKQIIKAWGDRQAFAKQFAAGEIEWGAFRSYFGTFQQELIDEGLVDGDAVKAALVAALAV